MQDSYHEKHRDLDDGKWPTGFNCQTSHPESQQRNNNAYKPTAKQQQLLEFIPCSVFRVRFFGKPGIHGEGISHTLGLCSYQCVSFLVSLPSLCLSLMDALITDNLLDRRLVRTCHKLSWGPHLFFFCHLVVVGVLYSDSKSYRRKSTKLAFWNIALNNERVVIQNINNKIFSFWHCCYYTPFLILMCW